MGKIVLYRQDQYEAFLARISEASERFSLSLTEFNGLNLFKLKGIQDFGLLIRGGEVFVKARLAEELPPQSFGLFKIKKEAAVSLLDLPSLDRLNDLCKDCHPEISLLQYCQLKNDKVIIDPMKLEELKQAYTTVTRNAKEERLLSCYEALVKATSEFSKASVDLNCAPLYQDNVIGKFLNVLADGTVTRSEQFLSEVWGDLERKAEQARQTA